MVKKRARKKIGRARARIRNKNKEEILWWGLRISFFGMVGMFVLWLFIVFCLYTVNSPISAVSPVIFFFILPIPTLSSIIFSAANLGNEKDKLLSSIALITSILTSSVIYFTLYVYGGYPYI